MKASTILTAAVSATVAMTFAALPAAANFAGKKFERRIERQANRITQGVRSGELTRHEARHLVSQNERMSRKLRRFCRDSRLDHTERKRMRKMLSNANDAIYAEKHDDERRYARGWRNRGDRHNNRISERFDDAPWYNYRRYTRRWQ